jgi:hypothetical protein
MNEKIKKMFKDVTKRKGEKIGENSLLSLNIKASDHDNVCPFRSIPVEECPLCILEDLENL